MGDRLDVRRRTLLAGGTATALGILGFVRRGKAVAADRFEVSYTEAEWRRRLDPAAFDVLRQQGTEFPGSSPLDEQFKAGVYDCAGCDLAVFPASTKFDSGTGWPSFYAPIQGAVLTSSDRSLIEQRTEVHCRRCGGHLGHVFNDGPKPTGLRYCMNGVALAFRPA
jgi:peptide-methionine (R)-S-oxide reductase